MVLRDLQGIITLNMLIMPLFKFCCGAFFLKLALIPIRTFANYDKSYAEQGRKYTFSPPERVKFDESIPASAHI